jgi:hypothetical protein
MNISNCKRDLLILLSLLTLFAHGQDTQKDVPHISYRDGYAELSVDGNHFRRPCRQR